MMLTPVKILSFDVCFGVHKDIEMMPTFLRCFPNVEVLHIKSADCDDSTGNLNLRFWEDQAGPIISVMFRIKVMTFSEFRGKQYELSFLQSFFESARVLKYAVIIMANPGFTSLSVYEMLSSVQNMSDEKWASKFYLAVRGSNGEGSRLWNFEQGADFSDEDPFSPVEILSTANIPSSLHHLAQRTHAGGTNLLDCQPYTTYIIWTSLDSTTRTTSRRN
uniref:Uncharacterized protein n=1 Tax=Avena sativa TaxID=4498 RepID=A0ACD5X4Q3_AVESA